jgi:Domain of unknown function (DUF1844)
MSKAERASADGEDSLPAIDFATFVLSLSHSALMHLGDAPDPSGGGLRRDVTMAKQTIELLALLQEKTAGNLSGEEERLLDQVMYDLRIRYEEVLREV